MDRDPRLIDPRELGVGLSARPKVMRNERGQIVWSLPGNTPEQNEQLGISNIQALFLEKFPDFLIRFPLQPDGRISEDLRGEAKIFIEENIGTRKKFNSCINGRWGNKISAPYFSGSVMVAKIKSFSPWGITFGKLDQADRTSGIYFDGQFEWANAKYFQRTIGITHRPIRTSLKGISTITVEDRARRSGLFYRIDEAMVKLSPYRVLPMTDRKHGRYTNESGVSFVARRTLARECNLDYGKVKSLAKNCSYIDGKDSSGHPVPLYKEEELVNRIEAFIRLPQVDKESKMYIDGEGESWVTTGFIHDKYHISQDQLRDYLKDILQINGRTAGGKQVLLYNLQQAIVLIDSIQRLPVLDKKTGRYVDDVGQIWININTFSREKGVDHTSLANRLSNSVCLQGRSVSGSRCALYREEDIVRVVNERNYVQTISPQDADEELGRLIKE